jgi:hypothetical protein
MTTITTTTPAPGGDDGDDDAARDYRTAHLQSISLNRKLAALPTFEEQGELIRSMNADGTLLQARAADHLLDVARHRDAALAAEARGDYALVVDHLNACVDFLRLATGVFAEGRAVPTGNA